VLTGLDPPQNLEHMYLRAGGFVPHRFLQPSECRLPECIPVPSQLLTSYHYTIITRVVRGRILLFRQIRWTNVSFKNEVRLGVLHFPSCRVLRLQHQYMEIPRAFGPPPITAQTRYGRVEKCPHCMAEHAYDALLRSGIYRVWQDLGSAENPRHVCGTQLVTDKNKAAREAGSIAELFGPI
jgi:hypothetical protein